MSAAASHNVVLVLSNLRPGGAERQGVLLARALGAAGCRVAVAVAEAGEGPLKADLKDADIPVYTIGTRFDRGKITPGFWWNLGGSIGQLGAICRQQRATVLQSMLFWQNMIAVPAARLAPTVRAVITGRRNIGAFKDSRRYYQMLENMMNRGTDAVICNARAVRDDVLRRERIDAARVHVIPNAVDEARFANAAPVEYHPGALVVGTVGNLKRQKRHDLFVEACAKLAIARPGLRGVIVGRDLGEEESVRDAIAKLGAPVEIIGGDADPAPWLRRFDVFLLASDFEGMPNVVLEAMAAGIPVVATNAGGTGELIADRETGLLVPTGDVPAMVEAVERLLADETLNSRLVAQARAGVIAHHTPGDLAAAHIDLYDRLSTS